LRCSFAIHYGTTLRTRCSKEAGHELLGDSLHVGRGLAEFSYQTVQWFAGDRREYPTERDDEHSWEEGS
jgi:hypothetical protein